MSVGNRLAGPDAEPSREQARFEEGRVAMVLEAFGLAGAKWELLDAHGAETGVRRLTFAGFRRRFPTFPVVFDAKYSGRLGERVRVADLFRRPDRVFLSDMYLEAFARRSGEAGGRPVGLVVPFDGVRSGVAIHNGESGVRGVRLAYPIPGDAPPHHLTAEPFGQLLKTLAGGGWTPAAVGGDGLPTARPEPKVVTATLAPWMSERLGTGPAFSLLVWLTGIMDSASALHRFYVRRGKNGLRYVAATYDELATVTGMSRDKVKRGLAFLKAEGLVRTLRRDGRTAIVLDLPDESYGEPDD